MDVVRIITKDGKVFTKPQKIHIPRNGEYAAFYRIVDHYKPSDKKKLP